MTPGDGGSDHDDRPGAERFLFVHMQKTAGTALLRRLRHHFDPDEVYPTRDEQGTPPAPDSPPPVVATAAPATSGAASATAAPAEPPPSEEE